MSDNPTQPGGYGNPSDPPTQPQYPYQSGGPWVPPPTSWAPGTTPPGGPPPKRGWSRTRKLLTALAVVIVIVVAASVAGALAGHKPGITKAASTPSASAPPASTAPTAAPSTAAPSSSAPNLTGPLGTTYTDTATSSSGAQFSYDVTAVQVVDPATGTDEFNQPSSGDRLVAVEFRIKGDTGYSHDDSNSDASVTGSDGQTYTSVFDTVTAGTNFNGGDFGVSSGQTQTGYVTFQLPADVKVASVQWQPDSFSSQPPAIWTVSGG